VSVSVSVSVCMWVAVIYALFSHSLSLPPLRRSRCFWRTDSAVTCCGYHVPRRWTIDPPVSAIDAWWIRVTCVRCVSRSRVILCRYVPPARPSSLCHSALKDPKGAAMSHSTPTKQRDCDMAYLLSALEVSVCELLE
jgi:hypothetical protein